MRYAIPALLLASLLAPRAAAKEEERRPIDLVICLDTSGSMEGLIDSARRKIWAIVNDLALAKPAPRLRVALLSYGNDGHDAAAGWVKLHTDFTEDLDAISETLFGFSTNGGTELVGRVLRAAVDRLSWTPGTDNLKLIVVASNESADQDREVDFRTACRDAIAKGIQIDPIYCVRSENVIETWREIARLADGHFAAIDQNNGTVDISSPFDARLGELNEALNATYIPFGARGAEGKERQAAQDEAARKLAGGVAADRATAKSQALYNCRWCLVDATRNKDVKLEDVPEEDLPEAIRGKTLAEKQAWLDDIFAKRQEVQKRMAEVQKERQEWIAAELKKRGENDDQAFDAAVRTALREQAAAKGFAFEEGK